MRKFSKILLAVLLTVIIAIPNLPAYAVTNAPTRIINVVYDDSGSMIVNDAGADVDTWCQAKYSMEVFAAMLGAKDTMNIYVMSDYYKTEAMPGPKLTLSGSSGAGSNVKAVHDMVTNAVGTPFNTVRKAYNDLSAASADEKWLIILTDGAFEGVSDIDNYFASKDKDISVMFLGMGADAQSIAANEANGIYFEKAETNSEILNKITEICTRIFNMNKLVVDISSMSVSFDIPMSELIVFAQGQDVSISGIKSPKGKDLSGSTPVSVKYSEVATTNSRYKNVKIDYGLQGTLITYSGDFDAGEYSISAKNAETIEVYYKPSVEIMAFLTDLEGNELASTEGLEAGEYTLEFGFVKAGTTERVKESKLLGEVTYRASMAYNGTPDGKEYHSGDKVTLEQGVYEVDVSADFLKYNTVNGSLNLSVYKNREIELTIEKNPEYVIDKDGIQNANEPIVLKATVDGEDIPEDAWAAMDTPTITKAKHADKRVELKVEKSDKAGYYNVYPYLTSEKPKIGDYKDFNVNYEVSTKQGLETWEGDVTGPVQIDDQRSWWLRHLDLVIKLGFILLALLIFLAYALKKKLPKKLVKAPLIEFENRTGIKHPDTAHGRYKKDKFTVFFPLIPERGTIRYVPDANADEAPELRVKAVGHERMEIMNKDAFADKDNIQIGNKTASEMKKKDWVITGGTVITVEGRLKVFRTKLSKKK